MNCKYCRANCTGAKKDRELALCLGYDPPKTNGDFIRALNDEELAVFLNGTDGDFLPTGEALTVSAGEKRWLDWLKQEADDGTQNV